MFALLAQVRYSRRREFYEDFLLLAGYVFVVVLILLVVLAFLSAISRALQNVSPENRRMRPGQVWLNLIPAFNLVWATVTVERVAESLKAEFAARGLHGPDETYGRRTGLTLLALLASIFLFLYPALMTYPLALGYMVSYWKHMNRYAARLKSGAYAPPPTDEGW